MTPEELQAIEARCDKATEGPWGWDLNHTISVIDEDEWGTTIVQVPGNPTPSSKRDAEFIAHSREDIPKLLTEVKRLQKVVEQAKDYVNPYQVRHDKAMAPELHEELTRVNGKE